jgi:hypothetical protein
VTLRDEVWHEAIVQLRKTGKFKICDLPFEAKKRHTVRRVLREMEKMGWLTRDSKYSSIWRLGRLAKELLNVSSDLIDESQE